jgi:hypothetical protein
MLPSQDIDRERLLHFNVQVLDQALALVAAHREAGAPDYARPVGAHLRHVIEHYEALLQPAEAGVVDYDQRPRDGTLERDPALADARLRTLRRRLTAWAGPALDAPLRVRGVGGVAGDFAFCLVSSLARELVFVASHAIHHFALLHGHCLQRGIRLGAEFGRAPATVAHERGASALPQSAPHAANGGSATPTVAARTASPLQKESPCLVSPIDA